MPDDSDPGRVDAPHPDDLFHAGRHALDHRNPGLPGREDDIGLEDEIPQAGEDGRVVVFAVRRRDIAVDVLRQQLVDVDDHGYFCPPRIRPGSRALLQGPTLWRLVIDELAPSPSIIGLKGIGRRDLLGAL